MKYEVLDQLDQLYEDCSKEITEIKDTREQYYENKNEFEQEFHKYEDKNDIYEKEI